MLRSKTYKLAHSYSQNKNFSNKKAATENTTEDGSHMFHCLFIQFCMHLIIRFWWLTTDRNALYMYMKMTNCHRLTIIYFTHSSIIRTLKCKILKLSTMSFLLQKAHYLSTVKPLLRDSKTTFIVKNKTQICCFASDFSENPHILPQNQSLLALSQ